MTWLLLGGLAIFFLLAYVGGKSRKGELRRGPWIRDFRVLRSVLGIAISLFGAFMLFKGQWIGGVLTLVSGLGLLQSTRFARASAAAAEAVTYSQAELQAYKTLGLNTGAGRGAINSAWKKLMRDNHPDRGGDPARAQAINAARDVLLKRRA